MPSYGGLYVWDFAQRGKQVNSGRQPSPAFNLVVQALRFDAGRR